MTTKLGIIIPAAFTQIGMLIAMIAGNDTQAIKCILFLFCIYCVSRWAGNDVGEAEEDKP